MSEQADLFVPAKESNADLGQFTRFDPGTKTLPNTTSTSPPIQEPAD